MKTSVYDALTNIRTVLMGVKMPMPSADFENLASSLLQSTNEEQAIPEIEKEIQEQRRANDAIIKCHFEMIKKPCLDIYNKAGRGTEGEEEAVNYLRESKPGIVCDRVIEELMLLLQNSPPPVAKPLLSSSQKSQLIKSAVEMYNKDIDSLALPIHQSIFLATHNTAITSSLCYVSKYHGDDTVRSKVKAAIKQKFVSVFKLNDVTAVPPTKLQKKGEKYNQSWKTRDFTLETGKDFITYHDRGCLKGKIDISEIVSVTCPDELNCSLYTLEESSSGSLSASSKRREFEATFEIQTPDRIYQLAAVDEASRNIWVLAVTNRCRLGVLSLEDIEPTL
eukprot:TRINITY_DN2612_c0_g1_i1.p1 TRINITY_DN2612_c0_g1~~TRINITY_DN2612_c0_g1_i1.p1  ORF type:complete len:336 (+),score=70.87 TRINITY_DN2612_c0_g1_i1:58-1065(+)